ncbi:lipopolysaccharide kinase InaA family protein [Methylobacillus caricis]|uniref:lipopolysaccharide kinase InaA family protein n=1 Tax=Methylobacillus caricis TaxID=1971611 RepID=UPI001CFF8F17|nr:lipopolysaccharide kinase InaA family protein [Methylobacillus caricis]MCB5186881.1 lipopolysaccharide kinase InaA family protein [Methylobacillus caricis]
MQFISPEHEQILRHNKLNSFEQFWNFQGEWFEEPNHARQGWSGVNRVMLDVDGQAGLGAFLKRQHNYIRRTWRHPFSGVTTFFCEFTTLCYLIKRGVPVPTPLFFDEQVIEDGRDAVLVTAELAGYRPLDVVVPHIFGRPSSLRQQRALIRSLAAAVAKMHAARMQHRALYPKHLFVRQHESGNFDTVIIDLEKARIKIFPILRTLHDLATLNRELSWLSRSSRLYFLKQYYASAKLGWLEKRIALRIDSRSEKRRKGRY